MVKEYLKNEDLKAVRRFTSSLYEYPPSVWLRLTYEGEAGEDPKITALDLMVLRFLCFRCRYDPESRSFSFISSIRRVAKAWGKDPKRVGAAIKRLEASGAVEVEKVERGFSRYKVRHFEPTDLTPILKEQGLEKFF